MLSSTGSSPRTYLTILAATSALAMTSPVGAALVLGHVDTFEDGTTQDWANGGQAFVDPPKIDTGGPAGAGDHYLLISADGAGAGGRITAFNRVQWAGDYSSAHVAAIEMDLFNPNAIPLSVRIALKIDAGPASAGVVSTNPFMLSADGVWHHARFLLDAGSLTGVNSPSSLNAVLGNVFEFRILHATTPVLNGDPIIAQLGVDNISAPVPEPGTALLFLGGCALLLVSTRVTSAFRFAAATVRSQGQPRRQAAAFDRPT